MNEPNLTTQGDKEISPKSKKYQDEFEDLWNLWPKERRCEKPVAYREWLTATTKISPAELLQAVKAYLLTKEATDGFAPYPAKWLKRERWLEFQPEAPAEVMPAELGRNAEEKTFLTQLHEALHKQHGDSTYRSWFRNNLCRAEKTADGIYFPLPTRFVAEWVKTHYASDIERITRSLLPHVTTVKMGMIQGN